MKSIESEWRNGRYWTNDINLSYAGFSPLKTNVKNDFILLTFLLFLKAKINRI